MIGSLRYPLLVLVLVCLVFPFISCAEEDSEGDDGPPTYDELIARGKSFLQQQDGRRASRVFLEAYEKDSERIDAPFGLAMTGPMLLTQLINEVIGTISALEFSTEGSGNEESEDTETKSDSMTWAQAEKSDDNQIHVYLLEFVSDPVDIAQEHYLSLLEEDAPTFDIDDYALLLGENPLVSFSGTFNKTDLQFIGALTSLTDAFARFLLAYNLYYDYTMLVLPDVPDDADTLETVGAYLGLVENLLTSRDFPDFLKLVEGTGGPTLQTAGIQFGHAFSRFAGVFDSLNDASDGQITYTDIDNNGAFTPGADSVQIGTLALEPEIAEALVVTSETLAGVFYEGSEYDLDPATVQALTPQDLETLLTALEVLPIQIGDFSLEHLPAWPAINIGSFFSDPQENGLRDILFLVLDIWNLVEGLLD